MRGPLDDLRVRPAKRANRSFRTPSRSSERESRLVRSDGPLACTLSAWLNFDGSSGSDEMRPGLVLLFRSIEFHQLVGCTSVSSSWLCPLQGTRCTAGVPSPSSTIRLAIGQGDSLIPFLRTLAKMLPAQKRGRKKFWRRGPCVHNLGPLTPSARLHEAKMAGEETKSSLMSLFLVRGGESRRGAWWSRVASDCVGRRKSIQSSSFLGHPPSRS